MMDLFVRHSKLIDPCGDFRTSARLMRIVRAGERVLIGADKYDTAQFERGEISPVMYRLRAEHRQKYWKAICNIARYVEAFK